MRHTMVVLVVLLIAGCEERNEVINPGNVSYPLVANLHPGESYSIPQSGFRVTFDSVTSDSRCPVGYSCFWQGDGATRLSVFAESDVAACTLHTTLTPQQIAAGGHIIRLTRLSPYPQGGSFIRPAEYVASLEIDRLGIR